jgi:hypothetical protein
VDVAPVNLSTFVFTSPAASCAERSGRPIVSGSDAVSLENSRFVQSRQLDMVRLVMIFSPGQTPWSEAGTLLRALV